MNGPQETYRYVREARVAPVRVATLVVLGSSPMAAALHDRTPVVVGRASPADLVVDDQGLSRQHARFTWQDDGVLVEDLGSTNGTFVNRERVQSATVSAADEVLLGEIAVSVHGIHQGAPPADESDQLSVSLREELRRARAFGRTAALLAIRRAATGEPGWEQGLRSPLRSVDTLHSVGANVVVAVLAEALEADLDAWSSRFREHAPGQTLHMGGAVFPTHGADPERLVSAAIRAASTGAATGVALPEAEPPDPGETGRVVLESPGMKSLYALIERVSRTTMPVLVHGETGAGKELVAASLHETSPRCAGPLKTVNCATIPANLTESVLFGHEKGSFTGANSRSAGVFEQAHGGTVFLDEVGELPAQAQAALLRVLETKRLTRVGGSREFEVDVRVVAATHRDLSAMVAEGTFREDLLYRLDALTLQVPPLRERVEDIAPLAALFLERAIQQWDTPRVEFEDATLDVLRAYSWPGNVRQLKNTVERASVVAVGATITVNDLPPAIARLAPDASSAATEASGSPVARTLAERVAAFEREVIREALAESGGNQTSAARLLNVPRRTLANKVTRYGLG